MVVPEAGEEEFVDAVAVHVHDFEAPAVANKTFAGARDVAEVVEREAAEGSEVAVFLTGERGQ